MKRVLSVSALVAAVAFTMACAGSGGPSTFRIDFSHVDGASCMISVRSGAIADNWDDISDCEPRGTEGLSDVCHAAANAECCTQVGATMMGWEVHRTGNQTLASPVCKL